MAQIKIHLDTVCDTSPRMRNMFMATILLADDIVPFNLSADVLQVVLCSLEESCIE